MNARGRDRSKGQLLGRPPASARVNVQDGAEALSIPLPRSKRRGDTTPHGVSPRHIFAPWRRPASQKLALEVARDRRRAAYERARAASDRAEAFDERAAAAEERVLCAYDRSVAVRERAVAARDRTASHIDELTHVRRRGAGMEQLLQEIDRARRRAGRLVLAFVDVDGLKRVNDTRGHMAGDALLRAVADSLSGCLRSYDMIMRYGGDEFVCVLPDADAGIVRQRFASVASALAEGPTGGSITVGYAVLLDADSAEDLIQRADACLLEARGRSLTRR